MGAYPPFQRIVSCSRPDPGATPPALQRDPASVRAGGEGCPGTAGGGGQEGYASGNVPDFGARHAVFSDACGVRRSVETPPAHFEARRILRVALDHVVAGTELRLTCPGLRPQATRAVRVREAAGPIECRTGGHKN